MSNAATTPLARKLADFCDLRHMAAAATAIFAAGALVCGTAPSIQAIIVGRIFNGVGGAGVYQV
jgi:predicted MFS family arabinose efflux permease